MSSENALRVIDPYATHLPLLSAAVRCTSGPILECGGGDHSTSLLTKLARNREVFSCETDTDWLLSCIKKYGRLRYDEYVHYFMQVPDHDWTHLGERHLPQMDVVLVDAKPASARLWLYRWALEVNRSKVIVVHDVEDNRYLLDEVYLKSSITYYDGLIIDKNRIPWTAAIINSSDDDEAKRLYDSLWKEINPS